MTDTNRECNMLIPVSFHCMYSWDRNVSNIYTSMKMDSAGSQNSKNAGRCSISPQYLV